MSSSPAAAWGDQEEPVFWLSLKAGVADVPAQTGRWEQPPLTWPFVLFRFSTAQMRPTHIRKGHLCGVPIQMFISPAKASQTHPE